MLLRRLYMKKKKSRYFFKTLFWLFVVFIALIIAYESGYYETKAHNRATLTSEAIKKFESDVKNGQVVDLSNYLKEEKKDYSSGVTKIGNKISNSVSEVMTKGISGLFNALKGLFW